MNLFCKKFCLLSLFGIMVFSCSSVLLGWDYFHNDIGRTGYVDRQAPSTPQLDWKFNAGSKIYSSPVVYVDGTIFICSYDGLVYALDPDGEIIWSYQTEGQIESTPALDPAGVLYVGDLAGKIYAIDAINSSRTNVILLWQYPLEDNKYIGPIYSSPVVDGRGNIIFGSDDQNLYCLLPTGKTAWPPFSTRDKVRSSPAIDSNGIYYIASYDGYLYAIDSFDGDKLWDIYLGFPIHSTPAISVAGIIHVCTKNGILYFIDSATGAFSSPLYRTQGFINRQITRGIVSSPAVTPDGFVFFGGLDKFFYSVNPYSITNFIFPVSQKVTSSPALTSDGTLIFGDMNGNIIALESLTGNWKWAYDLDEYPVSSSPSIGYEEYYVDMNGNGQYDRGENFYDQNNDGLWNPPSIYIATESGYLYALKEGVNQQPVITDIGVTPDEGDYFTTFRYHFRYDDADNNPALVTMVYINGAPHQMNFYGDDRAHGVYEYETKLEVSDAHTYYFVVGDGITPNLRFPKESQEPYYTGPKVTSINLPSVLKNGKVDPSFGDLDTNFNFFVDWNDQDAADSSIPIDLMLKSPGGDWVAYTMSSQGSSAVNVGFTTFAVLGLQLPHSGEHQFYFIVTDTAKNTTKYPATGYLTGPTVRLSGGSPWSMRQQNSEGRARSDYRGPDVPVVYWRFNSGQSARPTPTPTAQPTGTLPTPTPETAYFNATQIDTSGNTPDGREGAKLLLRPSQNEVLIASGTGASGIIRDTFRLNLMTGQYMENQSGGNNPYGGHLGAAAEDQAGDRLFYFDMGPQLYLFTDYKILFGNDISSWTTYETPFGTGPVLMNGEAVYDSTLDRVLFFGGGGVQSFGYSSNTYILDYNTNTWTLLSTSGVPPSGRSNHAAIYRPTDHSMVIFGGRNESGVLNELFSLNLMNNEWTQLNSTNKYRENGAAIYDSVNDRFIIFGGSNGSEAMFGLSVYDFSSSDWIGNWSMGGSLMTRVGPAASFNASASPPYFLIFGGMTNDGQYLNDIWKVEVEGPETPFAPSKPDQKDVAVFNARQEGFITDDCLPSGYPQMPQSGEFQVNTTTEGEQWEPSVAINNSGNFIIAWTSSYGIPFESDIFLQRFDSSGNPQGREFQSEDSGLENELTKSAIAMDSAGNFIVAKYQDRGTEVGNMRVSRYDSSDSVLGGSIIPAHNAPPSVAMNNAGRFVVAYEVMNDDGNTNIFAYTGDINRAIFPSTFQVNTYTGNRHSEPDVAMDNDGNFVIVWWADGDQDGNSAGVFGRRFASSGSSGTPLSGEFQVNTYTQSIQANATVAMNNDGAFVVTWNSLNQIVGSGNYDVFAQRFDPSGNRVGSEIQVNTYTQGSQEYADIAMDGDGNFVITWQSWQQDDEGTGIIARKFDSNGNPLGGEFIVNLTTVDSQSAPQIAMNSAGNYVITWQSFNQDGSGNGVFARMFEGDQSIGNESAKIFTSPVIDEYGNIFFVDEDGVAYSILPNPPGAPSGQATWTTELNSKVYSTPAISGDGNFLYFGSEDFNLYSLDRNDGTVRWAYDTGGRIYSSPTIGSSGNIYFGNDSHRLYAVKDVNDSPVFLWSYRANNAINSSPAVFEKDGVDHIIFSSVDGQVYYFKNYNDDYPILEWVSSIGFAMNSSPVISDDLSTVYVGCNNRYLYALDINNNGWEKWRFLAKGIFSSSVAIGHDGTIYAGCEDGRLYAINNINGREKWNFPTYEFDPATGEDILSKIKVTPAVDADGRIYFGSLNGYFYALDSEGNEIWKYKTGLIDHSSACIDSEGRVYVGTSVDFAANYIYSFNNEDPYAPYIEYAGFEDNVIKSDTGGDLLLRAYVTDPTIPENISYVELYDNFNTEPEDAILLDLGSYPDELAGDRIFTTLINIPANTPRGEYAYQLVAIDKFLNESTMWPYLIVNDIRTSGLPRSPFFGKDYQSENTFTINVSDGLVANFTKIAELSNNAPQQGLGNPPRVIYGGFLKTELNNVSGGTLNVIAQVRDEDGVNDISRVVFNVLYLGLDDGGEMNRTSTVDPYTAVYEYSLDLTGGLTPGLYLNHTITAFDRTNLSGQWPLVIVE